MDNGFNTGPLWPDWVAPGNMYRGYRESGVTATGEPIPGQGNIKTKAENSGAVMLQCK